MQKPALIHYLTHSIEDFFNRQPVVIPSDAAHEVAQIVMLREYVAQEIPDGAQLTTCSRFDGYEVRPVVESNGTDCEAYFTLAEAAEELARLEYLGTTARILWTVYGHLPGQGVEALEDCDSEEQAHACLFSLSGIRGVRGEWYYRATF